MKPKDLNKGDKLFFIYWDWIDFTPYVQISEVDYVFDSKDDHTNIRLYSIIGDEDYYILDSKMDLSKINVKRYYDYEFVFITANEKLFTELMY